MPSRFSSSGFQEFQGLSTDAVIERRHKFGPNQIEPESKHAWWKSTLHLFTEPIFILLIVACALYLVMGEWTEAIMMLLSIAFVAGIEVVQEGRSRKSLEALRAYNQGRYQAHRDGQWTSVALEEIVPDDVLLLEEGDRVPADGLLLRSNDLFVDEAVLTGESLPVEKSSEANRLFQGTTITGGQGVLRVTATGNSTEFGKLGKSLEEIASSPTPLQVQIGQFVKQMGWIGGIAFLIVLGLNLLREVGFWQSILNSLTLAMAILPEEIPVAFSAFMAIGAYRMSKLGMLAKEPRVVESLGSATIICLDKTGTLTENKMSVAEVVPGHASAKPLEYALWASEPIPTDAMEKAILNKAGQDFRTGSKLLKEYALSGKPPMMTHVWESSANRERIISCKGSVERIVRVCKLSVEEEQKVLQQADRLGSKGFRVLGVATSNHTAELPVEQEEFTWKYEGLVALYDPPKKTAREAIAQFKQASIRVVMITGDHPATAINIAREVRILETEHTTVVTGNEVMACSEEQLQKQVSTATIFARMFPDAKLRVVNAMKSSGEIVAMTGDGVNDGPALKSAQIGVAMGIKGTEIAKSAASLVLVNDDLLGMAKAVEMGRRIYTNLVKAIRYVIAIHLPIVLTVLVPLLLGWKYPHILLPLHVIFMELVMDPTAAITFENEPAEPGSMRRPPRRSRLRLFTGWELLITLFQGLVITLAVLGMYLWMVNRGESEEYVRGVVFTTLTFANLFLTLVNRSVELSTLQTLRNRNISLRWIIAISLLMLAAILYVPFLNYLFKVVPLSPLDVLLALGVSAASVLWFDLVKAKLAGSSR